MTARWSHRFLANGGTLSDAGNTYLSFTYSRPEPAPGDITYTVESSASLTVPSWSSVGLVQIGSTVNAGLRTLTIRDATPVSGSSKRFMRLHVVQP